MSAQDLPIYDIETDLVARLADRPRLIVQAPTGSGKSTQVPQMLLDHALLGDGQVVILQPRRLPTRLLAARVAQERGVKLGAEVGFQIRFDDRSGPGTRIKFETEGILLRQMLSNPTLEGVSAIIFDEFHERHLYGDITLGRALQIQRTERPDLLIVVMSATLDAAPLEAYLSPCHALTSAGRVHPVEIEYLAGRGDSRDDPVWELAVRELERVLSAGAEGDVLVFMPGAYEIHRTVRELSLSHAAEGFIVLPLHGELPAADQDAAVARYDHRKIVVSTNVAESSLTIDGIRFVIDSGLARMPRFDPHRGINTLLIEKISRASADQRSGRAGRTAPGACVRLWTRHDHDGRAAHEEPEIRRLDLAEVMLTLKAAGIDDISAFPWVEPPDPHALERAELLLHDLGAVEADDGAITPLGSRMVSFPVHPRYSRMLLAAGDYGCVRPVALIAALTQGRPLLQRRQGRDVRDEREDILGEESESDFFILMRAWRYADNHRYNVGRCRRLGIHAQAARQVGPLSEAFMNIARKQGLDVEATPKDPHAVQKCILAGFSDHLARRLDMGTLRCDLVHGRRGTLARESSVHDSPLIVAAEIHEIEGKERELNVLLNMVTAIEQEWLEELFPGDMSETERVVYDSVKKRVSATREQLFRDLVMGSRAIARPAPAAAAQILADEVLKGNLTLKKWDHAVEQWVLRVNGLAEWCPDLELPAIDEGAQRALVEQVCLGAYSYKDIKEKAVLGEVRSWLNASQQAAVDRHAPTRLTMPNGHKTKVAYVAGGEPFVSIRIQDLYDVNESPRIAMGRVPIVVHILGPNQRPVQVTQDLAGFWANHYPGIKKELQRKYPKHEWR